MQMLETKAVLHCPFLEVAERTLLLMTTRTQNRKEKSKRLKETNP
jgi:hypothetical protein